MLFGIRVDTKYGDTPKFLSDLSTYFLRYVYAIEKVGTPDEHVHLVVDYEMSQRNLQRIIKKYGYTGNKSYFTEVIEPADLDHKVGYAVKNGNQYVCCGFDLDYVEDRWLAYKDYVKPSHKKKTESTKVALFRYLDTVILDDYEESSIITYHIIKYHMDNQILLRRFQIIAYADTYACLRNPSHMNILACDLMSKR